MKILGIDLGTTNCTVSVLNEEKIEQIEIEQRLDKDTVGGQTILPSFVYFPLEEENLQTEVGSFALKRGSELPNRLISSAKSWLCHSGIDRRESFLPLNSEDIQQISPLEATTLYLKKIRESLKGKFDQVLITVPASFDPSARQLTEEAATLSGFKDVILLEEPLAAFYAWLHIQGDNWRKGLTVGDTVLVVDIGGGTTDFTLIDVKQENGDLVLERVAVGSHLLLGGDNIDMALAYLAKEKLSTLDDWQERQLVHACRGAKEQLLSDTPPDSFDIVLQGRGRKLIGGSLKATLTLDEVKTFVLDAFFPLTQPEEQSVEKKGGIQDVGLPYASDGRISCQLARFLSMNNQTGSLDHFKMPTKVLFNGGTLKSFAIRERLMALLNVWSEKLGKPQVQELPNADYDFAVSKGAVAYGLARQGKTIRVKGGVSRNYYIGVEESRPAVPGIPAPVKAICIVPKGMEEGSHAEMLEQEFSLTVGSPAVFRFFCHALEPAQMGDTVKKWKEELTELHSLETTLTSDETDGKTVRVRLESKVTELGVLELWCVAQDGRRWKLEFDVRKQECQI